MDNNTSLINWLTTWEIQKPGIDSIYQTICEKYSEPIRYYHNLEHVSMCLTQYSELKNLTKHPFEVAIAIWFHDVIYDPRKIGNEEKSAKYAQETLGKFLEANQIEIIKKLILITRHDSEPQNIDEKIMIDVDLAIFGQPPQKFKEYEQKIRKEYNWVPDKKYKEGRKNLLRKFLDRDCIFYTEIFRAKYEEQARRNLRKSISLLT